MRSKTKITLLIMALMLAGYRCQGDELINDIVVTQSVESNAVLITYNLLADAIITLGITTNSFALPDHEVTSLAGDVCKLVKAGSNKTIVWSAGKDWQQNFSGKVKACLKAWHPDNPPLYCAIDLTGGSARDEFPVYYYPSEGSIPGGHTSDTWKTRFILMRLIEPTGPDGFFIGSPAEETGHSANEDQQSEPVVLTRPYYIGIYTITQYQYYQVMKQRPSYYDNPDFWQTRPVERVTYYKVREDPSGTYGVPITSNWPQSDQVGEGSFMDIIREKTGINTFDLPTESQWEWACRAGTKGPFNLEEKTMDDLGRYRYNGGYMNNGNDAPPQKCTTDHATMTVGSFLPNAWGLYDMHGNVKEWCLDWYSVTLPVGEDPRGPLASAEPDNPRRVTRGGCWHSGSTSCRSAIREFPSMNSLDHAVGFRLTLNLPVTTP